MVDLAKYEKQVFKGKISMVRELTLREYLTERHGAKAPGVIAQFNEENLDRPHLILIVDYDGTQLDWFGLIPLAQGWVKSNLKRLKERNGLPDDTKKWVGKEIELRVDDKKGFMRVAV